MISKILANLSNKFGGIRTFSSIQAVIKEDIYLQPIKRDHLYNKLNTCSTELTTKKWYHKHSLAMI